MIDSDIILSLLHPRVFITLTFNYARSGENTLRSQIGHCSLTKAPGPSCILDETVLTRNSTFPETKDEYVTYIALPGSGTMRGE